MCSIFPRKYAYQVSMSIDVRFQDDVYCIVLPELPRSDPYDFLKEALSLETGLNMIEDDIEVPSVLYMCSALQPCELGGQL